MSNAILVHGKPPREKYENPNIPKPPEANWFPWIGKALRDAGVEVAIPAMPRPFYPVQGDWVQVFEAVPFSITKDTTLVAHSAGTEFLLRWLTENPDTQAKHLALVAPYRDYDGKYGEFSKFDIDSGIADRVGGITVFNSLDDGAHIQRRVDEIADALPTTEVINLDGYGHFMIGNNMQSPEFPELRDVLLPR